MPDSGVDAREERFEVALAPFVRPFDIPLAAFPTAAGFLDQGVGAAAAGCAFGAPKAGKASSDWVSRAGLLGAVVCGWSRAGCFPAAFADRPCSPAGVATRDGSVLIGSEAAPDGGGW